MALGGAGARIGAGIGAGQAADPLRFEALGDADGAPREGEEEAPPISEKRLR